ncbi:Kumamolysin [Cystobacter fuscus]|uniref:Kumamolysin n=1 Tax=Cystobacter fuscus TaxID=43 RepID=A0A250IVX6_9BACT|nr:Kumamolysin [Cystobacter fuscus]
MLASMAPHASQTRAVIGPQHKLALSSKLRHTGPRSTQQAADLSRERLAVRPSPDAEDSPPITVTFILRRRTQVPTLAEMEHTLPAARKYLSQEDIVAKYGATHEDILRVMGFAVVAGLKVLECSRRGAFVKVSGSVEALRDAFQVTEDARGFFTFHIPADVGECVRWILGLDDRIITRPSFHYKTQPHTKKTAAPLEMDAALASMEWAPDPLQPISYTPPEVARLYQYPPLTGKGQCLGIIALAGSYSDQDMKAYFMALGLEMPRIIKLGEGTPDDSWLPNAEVTQDIQIAAAICPQAEIVVYQARGTGIREYFDILQYAIFDDKHRPSVLSVSWSFPEVDGRGPTPEEAEIFDELFRLAALQGITVCSSSGDYGSVTPVIQQGNPCMTPAANFAATSPYVLGCGGTTLHASHGHIREEVVWNRLHEHTLWSADEEQQGDTIHFSMASGGGISKMFPLPNYQRSAQVLPAITRRWNKFTLAETSSYAGRGTPDVAANADMLTGYQIFFDGQPAVGGGTSAAAPMWAALVLLINQGLALNHGPKVRVGWLNPLLYSLCVTQKMKVIRPITQGSTGGYSASSKTPWNACTGLGTPIGDALAEALGAWPLAETRKHANMGS